MRIFAGEPPQEQTQLQAIFSNRLCKNTRVPRGVREVLATRHRATFSVPRTFLSRVDRAHVVDAGIKPLARAYTDRYKANVNTYARSFIQLHFLGPFFALSLFLSFSPLPPIGPRSILSRSSCTLYTRFTSLTAWCLRW